MEPFDRHTAFAYRGGTTFNRAGADIPGCEHAWPTRFQWSGRTVHCFPNWKVSNQCAGFNKSLLIKLNFGWQPAGAWLGADHGKNRRRLHSLPFVGSGIFKFHRLQKLPTEHLSDLGIE